MRSFKTRSVVQSFISWRINWNNHSITLSQQQAHSYFQALNQADISVIWHIFSALYEKHNSSQFNSSEVLSVFLLLMFREVNSLLRQTHNSSKIPILGLELYSVHKVNTLAYKAFLIVSQPSYTNFTHQRRSLAPWHVHPEHRHRLYGFLE